MNIRNRFAAVIALLVSPTLAHAVPVSFSFAGELTGFYSRIGGVERTLESLGTRAITGTFSYESDRQDQTDVYGLLRTAIIGDGFFFDAGYAGIAGAQSINRTDSATLDSLTLFEFYEYMVTESSYVTRTTTLDLFGTDMLNPEVGAPDSILDASLFEYGSGSFWDTYYDFDAGLTRQSGVFNITSISRDGVSVPEPGTIALLGIALLLMGFAGRARRSPAPVAGGRSHHLKR